MNLLNRIANWFRKSKKPKYVDILEAPEPEEPEPLTPQPTEISRFPKPKEDIGEWREEYAKNDWLPTPKTHRKTISHTYQPPAEQHQEAISRFMKGKASSRYLKTIKQSPKIRIDKDES